MWDGFEGLHKVHINFVPPLLSIGHKRSIILASSPFLQRLSCFEMWYLVIRTFYAFGKDALLLIMSFLINVGCVCGFLDTWNSSSI